jgi:hypothetical protein
VTTRSIDVIVTGDSVVEADEAFTTTLSAAQNATIALATATGTIVNDDAESLVPSLSISNARITEGDRSSRRMAFDVTLSAPTSATVTVEYDTEAVTASPGIDFTPAAGTIRFSPGSTLEAIEVEVIGDELDEPVETFRVRLHRAAGAEIARSMAIGTIIDDDAPAALPVISIEPVSVPEGDGGEAAAVFHLTLSRGVADTIRVDYSTADGSAEEGSDYRAAAGTVVFTPGETERTIDVTVLADLVAEEDETFMVGLTGPVGATLERDTVMGTIRDDDSSRVRSVFVIVGSGAGVHGAYFRTQLQLHNHSDATATGELIWYPLGGGTARRAGYSLQPHETSDAAGAFEGTGFGTIDIAPLTGPVPFGVIRVFNSAGPNGAPGFVAEAADVADAIRAGGRGLLVAPPTLSELRYNVGMRALSRGASLTFQLRRAGGDVVAVASRMLMPNTLVQLRAEDLFGAPLQDNDMIEVRVDEGEAIVYGSAVENASGDPSFILARPR